MLMRAGAGLTLLLCSGLASASVYKCVDPEKKNKTIYSAMPCDANSRLVFNLPHDEPVAPLVPARQSQSMALTLSGGENYTVTGSVKGVPVVYLVDTGASMISVSKRVMDRAGGGACVRYIEVLTSNGNISECVTIVPEVTFGIFRLTNVEVAIVPNMSMDALLGMRALRHFKVNQQDGVMTISN